MCVRYVPIQRRSVAMAARSMSVSARMTPQSATGLVVTERLRDMAEQHLADALLGGAREEQDGGAALAGRVLRDLAEVRVVRAFGQEVRVPDAGAEHQALMVGVADGAAAGAGQAGPGRAGQDVAALQAGEAG